jgi:hypothetical protein
MGDTIKGVENSKTKAVIFCKGCYMGILFYFVGFSGFPCAVVYTMAYVGFFERLPDRGNL